MTLDDLRRVPLQAVATYESAGPRYAVGFDPFVLTYSRRFGWRVGLAFALAGYAGMLLSVGGWAMWLMPIPAAAAIGYASAAAMQVYRAGVWDDNNWQSERVEAVPVEAPDDKPRTVRVNGRRDMPIVAERVGAFDFTPRMMGRWSRIDKPTRAAVLSSIDGVTTDNYGQLSAAMVAAGYWHGNSSAGYRWTPAGDAWRGCTAPPQPRRGADAVVTPDDHDDDRQIDDK